MILLNVLGSILVLALGLVLTYLLLLPFGAWIPINRKFKPVKNGIDIFLSTNGMHTDFILPTRNKLFDWSTIIDSQPYEKDLHSYPYLGVGWGDPGFYLELESWDKLSVKIAAKAMLMPTSTIMHIIGYEDLPQDTLTVEKITISHSQYLHLCSYIYNDFTLNDNQKINLIPGVGYSNNDNFYHANGVYHAFHTCNYWVNKGLKKIGVRTSLWSPFDRGIFYQLNKIKNDNHEQGLRLNTVSAEIDHL